MPPIIVNVSFSTSMTSVPVSPAMFNSPPPPIAPHAVPSYPSKLLSVVLKRNCPVAAVGLCAVVPTGTLILLFVSITKSFPSNVKLALSSSSPAAPAITILLSVRSLTLTLFIVTLPLVSTTINP